MPRPVFRSLCSHYTHNFTPNHFIKQRNGGFFTRQRRLLYPPTETSLPANGACFVRQRRLHCKKVVTTFRKVVTAFKIVVTTFRKVVTTFSGRCAVSAAIQPPFNLHFAAITLPYSRQRTSKLSPTHRQCITLFPKKTHNSLGISLFFRIFASDS